MPGRAIFLFVFARCDEGEGKTGIVIISEAEIESLPSACAKAHNVDSCEGRRWVEGQGRGDVLGGSAHCARTTITSGLQYMITAAGSVPLHSLFSPLAVPRIPRPSIAPPGKCRRAMCPVNSSRLQSSTLPARLQTRTCRHPHARSAAAAREALVLSTNRRRIGRQRRARRATENLTFCVYTADQSTPARTMVSIVGNAGRGQRIDPAWAPSRPHQRPRTISA
jgi:hypothetical protein